MSNVHDEMDDLLAAEPSGFDLEHGLSGGVSEPPKVNSPLPDEESSVESIKWTEGDTLYSASQTMGIPLEVLREWNGGSDEIQVGGTLAIPDDYFVEIEEVEYDDTPNVAPVDVWDDLYHTEATDAMRKDFAYKQGLHVKPDSEYYKMADVTLDAALTAFVDPQTGVTDENIDLGRVKDLMIDFGAIESNGGTALAAPNSTARGVWQVISTLVKDHAKTDYYGPRAQSVTGKSRDEVLRMGDKEIENWMMADPTANATFGIISLIRNAKTSGKLDWLR